MRCCYGIPGDSIDGVYDGLILEPVDRFDFDATFVNLSGREYACFVVD
jgi:hypothetical protein